MSDNASSSVTPITRPTPATLEVKPGWQTTEFYVTLLTAVLPLITAVFHRDFTSQVQTWSVAAATVATAVYSISRAHSKQSAIKSRSEVEVANAQAAGASNASRNAPTMEQHSALKPGEPLMAAVPLETLATILARLEQLLAAETTTYRRPQQRQSAS